jgi:hypothetical protein
MQRTESSVDIAMVTDWTAEGMKLDSHQGQEIFLFLTVSRPAQGPTQPPVQ